MSETTTLHKGIITTESLSNSDQNFLQELVFNWLNENGYKEIKTYAYSIEVEWEIQQ